MSSDLNLERRVSAWLEAEASTAGVDRVLEATLVRVADAGQVRGPSISIGGSRRRFSFAAGAAAVALLVVVGVSSTPMAMPASAAITGVWSADGDVAFTAEIPHDTPALYWRAGMFDQWSGITRSWTASSTTTVGLAADAAILGVANEAIPVRAREILLVTIVPDALGGNSAVAPGIPANVDQETDVLVTGTSLSLVQVELSRPGTPYMVTAIRLVPRSDAAPAGVSVGGLRVAGTDYPSGIRSQYLDVPSGELGPESTVFLDGIRAEAGVNPYEIAALIVERFQARTFKYDTDVRDIPCDELGLTECLMRYKRGYCDYYATAMIMLLREQGIPARFVQGFLPGTRDGLTEVVPMAAAHSWVEVYFPGWGWVAFDPTPGGLSQTIPIPPG